MTRRRFAAAVLLATALAACGSSDSGPSNGDEGHCYQEPNVLAECATNAQFPKGWICQDVAELTGHGLTCQPGQKATEFCCAPDASSGSGGAGGGGGAGGHP